MGASWSNRIKAVSPSNTGFTSKFGIMSDDIPCIRIGDGISSSSRNSSASIQSSNLKRFKYNDLRAATRNFHPDNVLGEGGSGLAFKGWINKHSFAATKPRKGMIIVVKGLNKDRFRSHEEWLAEINYLRQLQHPNVVKLIGYCFAKEHQLLVHEFMPNGSVENQLFRRNSNFQPLSWSLRLKIALGAARGLAFLRSTEHKVIYHDFKPSNILLDTLLHCMLLMLAGDEITHGNIYIARPLMGTSGYRPPEYTETGDLTSKSVVYSFGVVLMEMISGRRVLDKYWPIGEYNFVKWDEPDLSNKLRISLLMDPRLEGAYSHNQAKAAITLAFQCLEETPMCRPNMDEVVKALELLQESKDLQKESGDQKEHSVHGSGLEGCAESSASLIHA